MQMWPVKASLRITLLTICIMGTGIAIMTPLKMNSPTIGLKWEPILKMISKRPGPNVIGEYAMHRPLFIKCI